MKRICSLLLFVGVSFATHAQYLPPDFFGEPYKKTVGYWQNNGQIIDTQGDARPDIAYYSDGAFPRMYMRKGSQMSFVVAKADTTLATVDTLRRIDLQLTGELAQWSDPEVVDVKDHVQNFYMAHCGPSGVENVHGYSRVTYENVYPFIDMHFYSGSMGQKMSFVVRPGGNPYNLQLQFTGQDSLDVDWMGALRLWFGGKWVRLEEAKAYQVDQNNNVVPVNWSASYLPQNGTGIVTLHYQTYNPAWPLVFQIGPPPMGGGGGNFDIPGMCWSTYMGGGGDEQILESTQDAQNYFVTGSTNSLFATFPTAPGVNYSTAGRVAFLERFDELDQIKWKDFVGGSAGDDESFGTAVADRGTGNVYMAGYTTSTTMSQWAAAPAYFDGTATSQTNKGFIGRYQKTNGTRTWQTYFGDENLKITGMCGTSDANLSQKIYITGHTLGNLPALNVAPPGGSTFWNYSAGRDGFVCAFDDLDRHSWRTFLTGSADETPVDVRMGKNKVMVLGSTNSSNMHVSTLGGNAYEHAYFGGGDCFLYEFNAYCAWQWGSYMGGTVGDVPGDNALALDPVTGDVVIAGHQSVAGGLAMVHGPGWYSDAPPATSTPGFVCRIKNGSRSLAWQSYVNATSAFSITDIQTTCFDHLGNLFLGGEEWGIGFPVHNLAGIYNQSLPNWDYSGDVYEPNDMFVMSFTPTHYLAWSTWYGGQASDQYHEQLYTLLSRQQNGNLYGAGFTTDDWPSNFFYLDDGGGVPYFEPAVQGGTYEGVMFAFCSSAITGVDELAQTTATSPQVSYADGELLVSGLPAGQHLYELVDAAGRLVATGTMRTSGGPQRVSIPTLAEGVYIVHLGELPASKFVVTQP